MEDRVSRIEGHLGLVPLDALRIDNVTETLPRHGSKTYPKRRSEQITQIVIHHTAASAVQTPQAIANYHVKHNGWPGIAYHYLITPGGLIYKTNNTTSISYHAKGQNTVSLGICLIGDFSTAPPPEEQLLQMEALVRHIREELPNVRKVIPHEQVQGSKTACPGAMFPLGRIARLN